MGEVSPADVYTAREIAAAAGVSEAEVKAALGARLGDFVPHDEAVELGRMLVARRSSFTPPELFARFGPPQARADGAAAPPFAVSGGLHMAGLAVVVWLTSVGLAPGPVDGPFETTAARPVQLVFLVAPGPGGGGGGGGSRASSPAPESLRKGNAGFSSPVPRRSPPPLAEPKLPQPRPSPPLAAEPLPAVVAPVVPAGTDARDRAGVLERAKADVDSRGPGDDGGAGTGRGTGLGAGTGTGIGPGSGGGTGGGPYRPGSGIEAPRLLREIKADYTEDARRRSVEGDVVLEIVVRRDGSVGAVTLSRGLGYGLDERAIQAVRQWQFAPATRLGSPVDVMVEVAVEFRLR